MPSLLGLAGAHLRRSSLEDKKQESAINKLKTFLDVR